MTTTLHSTIRAMLGWTWRDRAGTSVITDSSRVEAKIDLADGVGMRQADGVWHVETAVLGEGQSVDLALDALQQSMFGGTVLIRLNRVKAIVIVNRNLEAGWLLVGGAATNEWHEPFGSAGQTVKVLPGSPLLLANCRDGWPVDAQHAALRLSAVGGSATFDIAILGTICQTYGSSSGSG